MPLFVCARGVGARCDSGGVVIMKKSTTKRVLAAAFFWPPGHDELRTEKTVGHGCPPGDGILGTVTQVVDSIPIPIPYIGTFGAAANFVQFQMALWSSTDGPDTTGFARKQAIERKCGDHSKSITAGAAATLELGGQIFGVDLAVADESQAAVNHESSSDTTLTESEEDVSAAHFTLQVRPPHAQVKGGLHACNHFVPSSNKTLARAMCAVLCCDWLCVAGTP